MNCPYFISFLITNKQKFISKLLQQIKLKEKNKDGQVKLLKILKNLPFYMRYI